MKTKLLNIITKNFGGFFCLAYLYTILMPWGTKDYTDRGFFLVLFQALFTIVIINLFGRFFGKLFSTEKHR